MDTLVVMALRGGDYPLSGYDSGEVKEDGRRHCEIFLTLLVCVRMRFS